VPLHKARVVMAPGGVVNVYVSPQTLYNLEATQQLTRTIVGRFGCGTCCSGIQILFQQEEREFNLGDQPSAG
jgi:hypothetical protein